MASRLLMVLLLLAAPQAPGADPSAAARVRQSPEPVWGIAEAEPDIELPADDGRRLRFVGSFAKAKAEARLRNVPIMVVLGEDTNTGLDAMLGRVFLQPAFREACADLMVPLIAMKGEGHPAEERARDGGTDRFCTLFQVPCAEHQRSFDEIWSTRIFRTYWGPVIMLLEPSGREILRLEGKDHGLERLRDEILRAGAVVGAGMKEADYRRFMARFAKSRELRAKRKVAEALAELESIERHPGATAGFRAFVRRERLLVDGEGQAECEAALALEAAGRRVEAVRLLREIARRYPGLPAAERARAALRDLGG